MHIEQLEYVLEVAKRGTISKAAEALHVSHSAISQAISNLEAELGIVIFKRSRLGSVCTEEGKEVLQLSREIVSKITELKELVPRMDSLKRNLSISASPIFFTTFLPEALNTFKKVYPKVQLEVNENSTESIIKSVRDDQFDLGLIFGSQETFKTVSLYTKAQSLYQPNYMVAVSKHSPLAQEKFVHTEQLIQYPLIVRNEKFAREVWDSIFGKYGKGEVFLHSNNDNVIKSVIANDLAIGFLTDLMKRDPFVVSGDIVLIPYKDKVNIPSLHLISIQPKNKYYSIVEKEFLRDIKSKINSFLT